MMVKLKIGNKGAAAAAAASSDSQQQQPGPPAQAAGPPQPPPPSGNAPFKLKLKTSQPPTPIDQPTIQPAFPPVPEQAEKKKRTYQRKQDGKGKKRGADDDNSPAAKRVASGPALSRKLSIKPPAPEQSQQPMRPKISLSAAGSRKASVPKIVDLRTRGKAPPRPKGVGYDSEDSDVEKDPAIQQGLVLRMEDGEDAQYLKEAIASGKIGPKPSEGDAEVSLKLLEKNYRRAVVKIRGRMYAAVLVDMPCIVETMKSFDKKGWWKVADITQMLLVLGRCNSEEEAKTFPLPRDVNKDNFQYAHGLTPPMHLVRKRRFRKRMNYNEIANVEEEVEKLLKADQEWEERGGRVKSVTQAEQERALEQQAYDDYDMDAEGEAVETVERDGQDYEGEDMEDAQGDEEDLEAQMQAMFDEDDAPAVSELVAESPAPIADQAASMSAVENMQEQFEETPVGTPADAGGETPMAEQSSDEDDESDEDEDSPDVVDEDAAAKAAERAQQLEEVADLEREVERARQKAQAMTNQLLRQREMQKLAGLEEDLRMKKQVFGLADPED